LVELQGARVLNAATEASSAAILDGNVAYAERPAGRDVQDAERRD